MTAELRAEMHQRLGVALRVGVLRSLSYSHGEIRRRLTITPLELKRAERLLRSASARMPGGAVTSLQGSGELSGAETALTSQASST